MSYSHIYHFFPSLEEACNIFFFTVWHIRKAEDKKNHIPASIMCMCNFVAKLFSKIFETKPDWNFLACATFSQRMKPLQRYDKAVGNLRGGSCAPCVNDSSIKDEPNPPQISPLKRRLIVGWKMHRINFGLNAERIQIWSNFGERHQVQLPPAKRAIYWFELQTEAIRKHVHRCKLGRGGL